MWTTNIDLMLRLNCGGSKIKQHAPAASPCSSQTQLLVGRMARGQRQHTGYVQVICVLRWMHRELDEPGLPGLLISNTVADSCSEIRLTVEAFCTVSGSI